MRRPGAVPSAGRASGWPKRVAFAVALAIAIAIAIGAVSGPRPILARPDEPHRLRERPGPAESRIAFGHGQSATVAGPARTTQTEGSYAWRRLSSPIGTRYAARAADGRIWLRSRSGNLDWLQAFSPDGRPLLSRASQDLIAAGAREIRAAGSLAEIWTVDAGGRIWLGPRVYDGSAWRVLAQDRDGQGFRLTWSEVSGLDADGEAVWVPFRSERSCAEQGTCVDIGLQAFDSDGPVAGRSVALADVPEAEALGLRAIYLPDARGTASAAVALARSQLHRRSERPGAEDYPLLGPPAEPGGLRNAGFLSTATQRPDGAPQALVWVEEQLPDGVTWRTVSAVWDDRAATWALLEDLGDGPLTADDPAHLRLVAAEWRPEADGLWCASTEGGVALRRLDGGWESVHDRGTIGLPADARILDLAAGADGRLWLVSDAGVWYYGPPPERILLQLPLLLRGR